MALHLTFIERTQLVSPETLYDAQNKCVAAVCLVDLSCSTGVDIP